MKGKSDRQAGAERIEAERRTEWSSEIVSLRSFKQFQPQRQWFTLDYNSRFCNYNYHCTII